MRIHRRPDPFYCTNIQTPTRLLGGRGRRGGPGQAIARVLAYLRRDDTAAIATVALGLVGDGAGSEFLEWRASMDLPAVADVIADPSIVDVGHRPPRPGVGGAVRCGRVGVGQGHQGCVDDRMGAAGGGGDPRRSRRGRGSGPRTRGGDASRRETACGGAQVHRRDDRSGPRRGERSVSEIRALTADEWRRLRLARMAAVEAMPYFARALFALSPVAAPGLKTFAVDKFWRLYVDPAMLGTDEGWSIPQAGAVLLHEVGHVLRDHGGAVTRWTRRWIARCGMSLPTPKSTTT